MQRVIRNFDMNRFGISGILIHVKGSFGKMTRTKTVRIRPWREGQRESVNMLDHPVSFASTQLILLRGVLQMKV